MLGCACGTFYSLPVRAGTLRHRNRQEHRHAADSTARCARQAEERLVYDSLRRYLDHLPSFGIYKDNYFITGIPTDRQVNKYTADAKFQISIRQILFRKILPKNNVLALTYTQKSFWDIYQDSFPFADNNYNPGLVASRPITRNGQLKGIATVGFEHESNGRDSIWSRSWNYFVLSCSYYAAPGLSFQGKVWPGWAGSDNRDLYDYRGWGCVAVNYCNPSGRFIASAVVTPRNKFRAFNTQVEANVKVWRSANQYLFVQWYQGYGEGLMNYNQYSSMVRVGICIKPQDKRFY